MSPSASVALTLPVTTPVNAFGTPTTGVPETGLTFDGLTTTVTDAVALRGSLPVVREDLSSRVGRRVSLLQDDPRLKQPPVDGILAGFLKELLGLLDDTIQRKTPKK